MGLFGFGKKQQNKKGIEYRMLFNAPLDDERDQQIKGLVLKFLGNAGVVVSDVKTTSNGFYGTIADFNGQPGESISIECARTPLSESSSSYLAINVKSNVCSEESIKKAFDEIKKAVFDIGYYFTEF